MTEQQIQEKKAQTEKIAKSFVCPTDPAELAQCDSCQ